MLTITYFYDNLPIDVDNIPKPIIDAFKGLVFADDVQVTDLLCRKRDLRAIRSISNPSAVLNEALNNGGQFVHVLVEETPDQEMFE